MYMIYTERYSATKSGEAVGWMISQIYSTETHTMVTNGHGS